MKTIDAGGTGFLRSFWSEHADCLPAAVAAAGLLALTWWGL